MNWLPTVVKLAADALSIIGGYLGMRWLLRHSTPKEDAKVVHHVYRLLRWDVLNLHNWFNMMPYRLAVVTSYELGIAQRNLSKLKARYEHGDFKEDSVIVSTSEQSGTDGTANGDTSTDGLASTQ